MPAIERRIVVLPQPDGPSRVKNVPLGTSRSTPRTAATAPKCFSSPSTRSDISVPALPGRSHFGTMTLPHRHGRACPGHPRITVEARMAGTRPAMTVSKPGYHLPALLRRGDFLLEPRAPFGAMREDVEVVDLGKLLEFGAMRHAGLGGRRQLHRAVHDRIAVGLGAVFLHLRTDPPVQEGDRAGR